MRASFLFIYCFLTGFLPKALSQGQDHLEEARAAMVRGNYIDSYEYYTRYFNENQWLGTIEDHLAYAEVLARMHRKDSAFLHLDKVVRSGHFFDLSRIRGSDHLTPLRRESRWKSMVRYLKKYSRSEKRNNVQPLSLKLERIFQEDQGFRSQLDNIIQNHGYPSEAYEVAKRKIDKTDQRNQRYIRNLLRRKGWPENLTYHAHRAIFLVIQHGDLSFQKEHKHYIEKAYDQGLIDGKDLALFTDRFLMYQDLPQLYGTQQIFNEQKKDWELYRVRDPDSLNKRRGALGLPPLEGFPRVE